MTQLILATSQFTFLSSERIPVLKYMVSQFMLKKDFFCRGLISRKLCRFLCFRLALLHLVSYFFFLCESPSLSLCMVFDSISFNTGEVLSINAFVFVSGDFITFQSQMTLLRLLTFLLGSQTVILIVLLFWIYLFLMLIFVLQWLCLH